MPAALFGIDNEGLDLAVNLIVLFLVVVWIALVVWTFLDARRRLEDPVLVASATVAALFPFVGTIVYSILRPPEFIEDRRERELEIRAAELRVRQLEEAACPNCGFPIERTYLRCPSCRARVKDPCDSCGKPIDPRWAMCPYCEATLRRAAPERAPAPRPARRAAAATRPDQRKPAPASTAAGKRPARPARQQPTQRAPRPASATRAPANARPATAQRTRKQAPPTDSQPIPGPEAEPAPEA